MKIDLNCDLGESFGAYKIGSDEQILDYVTSVNIACGFHAGDPPTMRKTVKLALEKGVKVGAHPGLPDLQGFGRREMAVTPDEAYEFVVYQIGALSAFVKAEGGILRHVKPHGALYNMAAKNEQLAGAIAEAIYHVDPALILYGLSNSVLIRAGESIGLTTANEVFADRTYQSDCTLTPRTQPEALLIEQEAVLKQVVRMVKEQKVCCLQGTDVEIKADTICIHGDGPHALEFARFITDSLQKEGIEITPL
ncbi:LamB/YcsF family protein [Alkalihalobacillus sp. AL-G]|uniref:LamB/YcsF family protein n=1 Tax=Alkalihalobacillus sp. AL-G TaxID=2926399 RepID=UPI00272C9450|nr:5-oxoprolinase subunit PxpA [Alkalihalobacillus sp. AL-G]WLD94211.1 LamB/YcsF family protein [Alkalihalobacillus sp. AL-G]